MSARDKLINLAWNIAYTPEDAEKKADRILAEHAHELAEQIRAYATDDELWAADLIDPKVET